jgi:hypothetical protein
LYKVENSANFTGFECPSFLNVELQSFFLYFRLFCITLSLNVVQKNHNGAQMVMAQMQIAGVKPDSETFSYLIMNCESEENISKVCNMLLPLFLFILWFKERLV